MPLTPPGPRWVRVLVAVSIVPLVGLLIGSLNGRPMFGSLMLAAVVVAVSAFGVWQRHRDGRRPDR